MLSSNFFRRQPKNRKTLNGFSAGQRRSKNSSYGYHSLEPRNLLASFSAVSTVTVNYVGDRPATVEIDGTTFDNPDATLDVVFEAPPTEINLRGGNGHNVSIGSGTTTVDDSVIFDYSNVEIPNLELTVRTGDGDDTVEEDGSFAFDSATGGRRVTLYSEGGNDLFTHNGGAVGANMGDGDDTIVAKSYGHFLLDGGDGKDRLTLSGEASFELKIEGERLESIVGDPINGGKTGTYVNYESLETVEFDGLENTVLAEDGSRTIINKESAWYFATPESSPIRFINVQSFGADFNARPIFQVVETAYPLNFSDTIAVFPGTPVSESPRGYGTVIIGGAFNSGDTSKVQHDVFMHRVNSLVVSNSANADGMQVDLSADATHSGYAEKITGLTPNTIFVNDVNHATLAGSNTGSDRFVVSHSSSHLVMFGNGGDDVFLIGYQTDGSGSDIGQAGNFINILGGVGDDFVRVNDQFSGLARNYRVGESRLFPAGNSPDKSFKGVWHRAERVELIANDAATQFYLTPAFNSQITISVGEQDRDPQETFLLLAPWPEPTRFLTLKPNSYVWWFGDDPDSAKFYSVMYRSA